jgi:putative molybdopterin biosynthesis protein
VTAHDLAVDAAIAAWRASWTAGGVLVPVRPRPVGLLDAAGAALAAPLVARHPSPPHRCAAMDGIAIVAATAGTPIASGDYAPIDTGQPLADRFDAVAPREIVTYDAAGTATLSAPITAGRNVREVGEDIPADAVLLPAGRLLTSVDIGLAAACGHGALVVRRPVVAVLATGDEVRPAGADLGIGEIADANGPMLTLLARAAGAEAHAVPAVRDDPPALATALRAATGTADLVLVIAGSARGGRDHTRALITDLGTLAVDGVAVRPGHPVLLGVVDATPVIGVPGYPVSAALTFRLFGEPALDQLRGGTAARRATRMAIAAVDLFGHPRAACMVPVAVTAGRATPLSRRGGALRSLATADGLVAIPAAVTYPAGSTVDIEPIA